MALRTVSKPSPRLLSLATAVPSHILRQEEVALGAAEVFADSGGERDRFGQVFRNAAIETRRSCVPLEWFLRSHGFAERNALYLDHAVDLLAEAARRALDDAGLSPEAIDTIVTVSSSGIATPTLDARLMGRMEFRADVARLPVFGLGCAGGVLGLARAGAMAQSDPRSRVLLLVVELCGLTFRREDRSKSNMVASALFADGAAAAVVSCRDPEIGCSSRLRLRLGPWGEHTWPDSLGIMGWEVVDDGLRVIFSRHIPDLVRTKLKPAIDRFLDRHGLSLADIDTFACHPGGAKVVDALEDIFGLQRGGLEFERSVLRRHGNMSAATVLFVLRMALDSGKPGRRLMTTLGPGFTAGFMMLGAD